MKSHKKRMPMIVILLGVTIFVMALVLAGRHLVPIAGFAILFGFGAIIYLGGCAALARTNGYTAMQGIFLGIAFPPALLLLVFFDRTKMSKKELETEDRENAEEEKAYKAARRRPLKGAKKGFAWMFGLFFLAVGLAVIAGYEIYWARVVVPERVGMATAISIGSDKLDPQNDGKLIHVTGELAGAENLTDPDFGVSVDALRLRRRVWMYQWQQDGVKSTLSSGTEDSHGATTTDWKIKTYNYSKDWSEKIINSGSFYNAGHDNPSTKEIPDRAVAAAKITLGVFAVAPELMNQMDNFQTVPVNDKNISALAEPIRARAKLLTDEIYLGANTDQPAIGDLKIKFESAPAATVSVIAQQNENNLSPYAVAKSGSIAQLRVGTFSVQEMTSQFAKDEFHTRVLAWIAGGVLILFGSLVIAVARRR